MVDMSLVHVALAIIGAMGTWNAFIEKRMHSMHTRLIEKINDKQEINKTVQQDLKDQVVRLEAKIDMLIQLNLRKPDDR